MCVSAQMRVAATLGHLAAYSRAHILYIRVHVRDRGRAIRSMW